MVELLLANSVNWQAVADGGRTALHVAAERGFADVAQALLEHRCDCEERTGEARTALICAAARGHQDVVARLLAAEADVQALDKLCQTALHAAAVGGKERCIELLHKKRARLEQKDGSGRTPMQRFGVEIMAFSWFLGVFKGVWRCFAPQVGARRQAGSVLAGVSRRDMPGERHSRAAEAASDHARRGETPVRYAAVGGA